MDAQDVAARIERARVAAGFSQRALAEAAGLSQPTLSRIVSGKRLPKTPELVTIAQATGHSVSQLTGLSAVADRVQCAARATNGSDMEMMHRALLGFLELNDYLDDQGIVATV